MEITNILFTFIAVATGIFSIIMFTFYLLEKESVRESFVNSNKDFSKFMDSVKEVLETISMTLTPKQGSEIYRFYEKFLIYIPIDVKGLFRLKNSIFAIVALFGIATQLTDAADIKNQVYNKFEYVKNPAFNAAQYDEAQRLLIMDKRNMIFDYIKDQYGIEIVLAGGKETAMNSVQGVIENFNDTGIDDGIMAEDMYKRIEDYNKAKNINYLSSLVKAFWLYFLPEAVIALINFFNQTSSRAEKRFMKRLIIMNGSIKPTDFMMVLAELIDKSKYYKKILLEIEDANKKNYQENTKIYTKYIQESKDLETKLFFEKLDEANNYDFDQAILNIKNEFNLDKRMQTRKCKKMVETIHVWGLLGFMALIVMLIMYLLMPWMSTYSLDSLGV